MHIDKRERNYIIFSVILLAVFAGLLMVSGFAYGIQVPEPFMRVDPNTVATPPSPWGAPVNERVRELAPNKYEAYILAQTWTFLPNQITVPVGSTVTFYVTSKDVQHGFNLQQTNINMMVLPGEVSTLTMTFDKPGEYHWVCNEYCGVGHQTMFGTLTVEP